MRKIPLTRGMFALVDDEDYAMLSEIKWHSHKSNYSYYAANGHKPLIYMHRMILGAKKGEHIDHQDHDTLNNQKSNIRIVTQSQNMRNTARRSDNTSGTMGVYYNKDRQKWHVQQCHKFVGRYNTLADAILAKKEAEKANGFHENHGFQYGQQTSD